MTERMEAEPDGMGAGVTLGAGWRDAHPAAIAQTAVASPSHRHLKRIRAPSSAHHIRTSSGLGARAAGRRRLFPEEL